MKTIVYMRVLLNSASKKTRELPAFDKKASITRLSKLLKPRFLPYVNDCFKNENNAVVGVSLQKLNSKTIFVLLLFMFFLARKDQACAQQESQYTHYMFNTLTVNPAYAGARDALNAILLSRIQWAGMEGGPRTYDFTMHTPISNYKMGLGVSIISDNYGPVNNLHFNLSYAYRVNITEKTILSMGIKGGVYNYHVNLTDLNVGETDYTFAQNLEQQYIPNAGMGAFFYSERFYFGASVPRLIQTELNGEQNTPGSLLDLNQHYYMMGGVVFDINRELKIKPSFITRMTEGAPFSVDVTSQLYWQDAFWTGVTYRLEEAVAFMGGIQVNEQLMIGYAYDYALSDIRTFSGGSHEIVLSYDFAGFTKKRLVSPRFFGY